MRRKIALLCCLALLGNCVSVSAASPDLQEIELSEEKSQEGQESQGNEEDQEAQEEQEIPVVEESAGDSDSVVLAEDGEPGQTSVEPVPIDEEHFPDAEFRRYLSEIRDKDKDQILSQEELENTKAMYFMEPFDDDDYSIKTYQGIEYLPFLEKLVLQYSYSITDLDVSKNAALTDLDISSTSIKELDLSCNANLKSLTVSGGTEKLIFAEDSQLEEFMVMLNSWTNRKLSDYDLSKLSHLERIYCDHTVYAEDFDFSQVPSLKTFEAEERMGAFDVSHNPALEEFIVRVENVSQIDFTQNPQLRRVVISDYDTSDCTIQFAENNVLEALNLGGFASLSVNFKDLTSLEGLSLSSYGKEENKIVGGLDLSNCTRLKTAEISYHNITDLDFSKNPDLEQLQLSLSNLKKLNISGCDKLNTLELNTPKLVALDLSGKASLRRVEISAGNVGFVNGDDCPDATFSVIQNKTLTLKDGVYYDLSKIPGFYKDRIISVTKAKLSGSKLYPESTKSICKYYVNNSKTRKATFVFHFKNTYAPENVKGVKVTGQTTTSISCKWNKIKGVDGYRLYAKNLDTGKLEKYVTIPKDSSTKGTVKGLKPGTGYRMVVKGYKKHKKKTYFSYYQYADTRLTLTKPSKPTLKAKPISDTEVKLTWKPVDLYGYNAGYLLYVKTSPNGKYTRIANVEKSRNMKGEYVATGLKPNKTYYFKMRAYTKIFASLDKCTAYSSYSKEVVAAP